MVLSEADVTQAGSYEVRLSSAGILLDRQVFDVGGTPPDWVTPLKAIGPDIAVEDVRVESANEVAVWQDPFAVAVKDNAGRALTSSADESLIASLYYLGHYTYGCAWSEGYYGASALVTDGKAMLPSPAEPGPYEIRVFRTLAFNGVPEDKLPPIAPAGLWSPASLQLIGVGHIKAVAPDAPGAIALSAAALAPHDTLNISVALPAQGRNPHAYQLELWLAGDRFPGGVLRAPTIYKSASISGARMTDADGGRSGYSTIAIEAPESKIVVDPLIVPGDYEIRLFDRTTGFHVARAPFAVRDPGPPAMPADARFVRNAITDWPAKEDPLRGLEAWYKPKDACEDPVFPEPPQLRLAELYSSDPENADDDQYVAVTSVQPGHPIFVEAEFTQAPPDDVYRVKVDGERKVRVFRTDNPRLYRSKLVTMIPNKAAP
jgi:hypothetical protein